MSSISLATVQKQLTQYVGVRKQREVLAKREEELKKFLNAAVEQLGFTDDKGHEFLEFSSPVEGVKALKREKRSYPTLNEDKAVEVLKEKELYERCTVTVVELVEDAIRACYYDGLLDKDDLDAIFVEKINFAFKMIAS